MSDGNHTVSAAQGRHRFTISTRYMKYYGIETPVSGATQIVTARVGEDRLDVYSIGSDRHIHHFTREASGPCGSKKRNAGSKNSRNAGSKKWDRTRLPWKAASLAVVPQLDGTDKVFFAEYAEGRAAHDDAEATEEKTTTLYELENAGLEPQRRRLGRFVTTDPKVYGVAELSGAQCRDGPNILVTALGASPRGDTSSWMVLFGHGSSTGALSLGEGKGVVADKVVVASEDPGSINWPHLTFVLLYGGELRVEWGARSGALLQSERLAVPELDGVVEYDVVRDRRGHLKVFALDREHHIHVLCQVGGGGSLPPRWASSWLRLDCTQGDGKRPELRRVSAVRRADGGLEIFALGQDDRLWSITERPEGSKSSVEGWGRLHDLGVHAAHIAVASPSGNLMEVFAVSRQNQLLWLRRDSRENWRLERIGLDPARSEKTELAAYRTGLTILDETSGAVAGVPVRITASERLPSTVNGLSYAIGPSEPVLAETNAFGSISVTFELAGKKAVPSLSFEAGVLGGGLLDVCPQRKAHLFVRGTEDGALGDADPRAEMYLIPEDTVIEQV